MLNIGKKKYAVANHKAKAGPAGGKRAKNVPPGENTFYAEIQQRLIFELNSCVRGSELEAMQRILMPNPWELNYRCAQLKHELHSLLEPMRPKNIRLFGSTVMGIAFRGMIVHAVENLA